MFSLLSCCTFPMCPHQELDVCEWPCRVQVCPILVVSKRILGTFCTTLKKLHNDVRHFHQTPSKHQRLNTSCCPRPWCCCCYLMQAAHTKVTVISTVIVLLHNSSYQQRKRKKRLINTITPTIITDWKSNGQQYEKWDRTSVSRVTNKKNRLLKNVCVAISFISDFRFLFILFVL